MKQTLAALVAPYRVFLRLPDVPAMIATAWLSRMPIGMNALAILLFMRENLGNFQLAGSIVGTFFVAMAIAAPVQGRLVDRIGPRLPLIVTGVLQPLLLTALFIATINGAPVPALMVIAAASGAFASPVTILTRTTWRHRFEDENNRKMAYSIDSIMIEINFTIGPLLVAAITAASSARYALATVIAISCITVLIFFASPILKYWKLEAPIERHFLGPLTDGKLVALFSLTFGMTFCFGLMEVGYPAYGAAIHWVAFGGVLLALNAIGSAVGGFLYGALHSTYSLERQFTIALAIMSAPLFLQSVVDQHALFALVAFLAGVCIAPALTAQTLLVSRLAPAKYATEAFTWSSTFIVTGLGVGMAAGGAISENYHVKAPFVLAGAIIALMAALSLLMRPAPKITAQ
ncbi:MAG: MFS transporter [Betaproteobacteria bacterium]